MILGSLYEQQSPPAKSSVQNCEQNKPMLISYPVSISLTISEACNAMNWPGGVAPLPLMLASPLTYTVHPLSVSCKCTLKW